jgi:hypothetical protein
VHAPEAIAALICAHSRLHCCSMRKLLLLLLLLRHSKSVPSERAPSSASMHCHSRRTVHQAAQKHWSIPPMLISLILF